MLTEKQKELIASPDAGLAHSAAYGSLCGYIKYNQWKDGDEFQDTIYQLMIEIENILEERRETIL